MRETLISREKLLESMRETYQYLLNLCNNPPADVPISKRCLFLERWQGELDMSLEMILRVKQQPTVYPDREVQDEGRPDRR